MTSKELTHRDYSVGWVCALAVELAAAELILDKIHSNLATPSKDPNRYRLGSIGGHNIAIAGLPEGDIGNNPAATVATRMTSTFPSIKFWLMVGIGGGVPPKVRLGDVVVSAPVYEMPGLVQWDLGIAQTGNNFRRIGSLDKPPEALRSAITELKARHLIHGSDERLLSILEDIRSKVPQFLQVENLEDVLFRADYNHVSRIIQPANNRDEEINNENDDNDEEEENEDDDSNCQHCDRAKVVKRKTRKQKTMIHYGLIASGNQVIKDAVRRDEINQRFEGNVLCFEMEGAGITLSHPCLVIRGICGKFESNALVAVCDPNHDICIDYSDSHKNTKWQQYAAGVAAAFAKELLEFVTPNQVNIMDPAAEIILKERKLRILIKTNGE